MVEVVAEVEERFADLQFQFGERPTLPALARNVDSYSHNSFALCLITHIHPYQRRIDQNCLYLGGILKLFSLYVGDLGHLYLWYSQVQDPNLNIGLALLYLCLDSSYNLHQVLSPLGKPDLPGAQSYTIPSSAYIPEEGTCAL